MPNPINFIFTPKAMSCAKADSCSHFREVESENLRDVCDVMKAGFSAHQNPVAKDDFNKM